MKQIYERYRNDANFLTIYIKEAHTEDEWQMEANEKQGICYNQPKSLEDRLRIASDFSKRFGYQIPLLVDPIENPANEVFAAWPERLYVIDENGAIVYKGKPGPFGYHPEDVDAWLAKRFPAS